MDLCYTGTVIVDLAENECGGIYYSTNCVTSPTALTYLGLGVNATQSAINAAIITFLVGKDAQITDLQSQISALEVRIIALEP